jgi:DNA (cytosine-5)-methyltransferase 1
VKMGSVCSGILGAELAAPSHWESAWCAEIDPFASRVIAHHRKDLHNYGDFTTIGPDAGPVDILAGGTPCQSFSIAGERGGIADARGNLSLEFAALAQRVSARWILWENVLGVLSSGGGADFAGFLRAMERVGYQCAWRILDAQFFALAQSRRRVFVVGYLGDWRPPATVLFEPEGVRRIPAPIHSERPATDNGGGLRTSSARDGDLVAKCITTKHDRGGPDVVNLVSHNGIPRYLTPLECERLQGFPDNWTDIPRASRAARYRATGNAWPVPVARWIMARIDAVNEVLT